MLLQILQEKCTKEFTDAIQMKWVTFIRTRILSFAAKSLSW